MFNQTKLELVPSIRVALLISIPCLASLILILLADIPLSITLLFIIAHIFISYLCITQFALLTRPQSICSIHVENTTVYLQDKSGKRYIAKPLKKNIIHQKLCLLSFHCEQIAADTSTSNPQTTQKIILTESDTFSSSAENLASRLKKLYAKLLNRMVLKPRRHLVMCSYNTTNSSAYRRIRVWFRFS